MDTEQIPDDLVQALNDAAVVLPARIGISADELSDDFRGTLQFEVPDVNFDSFTVNIARDLSRCEGVTFYGRKTEVPEASGEFITFYRGPQTNITFWPDGTIRCSWSEALQGFHVQNGGYTEEHILEERFELHSPSKPLPKRVKKLLTRAHSFVVAASKEALWVLDD